MKAEEKKVLIFQAAVKVIAEKGINQFSIQNVCEEAKISKGGLIYHFSSKEILIKSIHEYIIFHFTELIEDELERRKSYTEAFIHASLTASKSAETKAYMSLVNYDFDDEIENLWDRFYEKVESRLSKEKSFLMIG